MYKYLLAAVIALALLLRVVNLDTYPGGFTPDEASFGYDAYSLIKTGADQWGVAWPLTFKSFGDYKLPVYTYLTIPSVYAFGLNEYAVRLPNALIGVLAVLTTYFLALELFGHKKKIALLSALFLAVSPWHIALSRGAFEATLTTFFLTGGVYFFLAARNRQYLLTVAMFLFGINLFTYHSARFVTPLVVIALLWIYRKDFPRTKKYTLASAVFLVFLIGAVFSFLTGSGTRAVTTTIFSQNLGSGTLRANVVWAQMPGMIATVLYNEPLFKLAKVISQYVAYFSPQFLWMEGARETTYGMLPGMGVLSIFELAGLVSLIGFYRKHKRAVYLLLLWLLIGAFPAAVSVGVGHAANRAAIMMPAYQLLAAFGVVVFFERYKVAKVLEGITLFGIIFIGILSFLRMNYEQPTIAGNGMMYGMRELFEYLKKHPDKNVILSRSLSEPHVFAAFYDPIDPVTYQLSANTWNFSEKGLSWVDQQESYTVGRYTVTLIDKSRDFQLENTLIVGRLKEMPEKCLILTTINGLDGQEQWVVAKKI
jgi:4-amino-4-deoxy-L-arabinose transferase-like glycosyltransferase